MEAILNQSLLHHPYQASVTGKLTHLSLIFQTQQLLERCGFIFLVADFADYDEPIWHIVLWSYAYFWIVKTVNFSVEHYK